MRQPFAVSVSRMFDSGHRPHRRDDAVDVAVGEAVEVPPGAGAGRAVQAGGVRLTAVVVQAVIQRAVDDRVERGRRTR